MNDVTRVDNLWRDRLIGLKVTLGMANDRLLENLSEVRAYDWSSIDIDELEESLVYYSYLSDTLRDLIEDYDGLTSSPGLIEALKRLENVDKSPLTLGDLME